MNGMMTQNVRIKLGDNIEEAHMRNRALIANWCYEHADGAIELVEHEGKHYIKINDYPALRNLFAQLLAEIQRIKSEGDYEAAQHLVETYAVKINPDLHKEVLSRYEKLNIAPYKGFLNPKMTPVYGADSEIIDVKLDFTETYIEQMLRYSKDYSLE
jgi:dipeptidyl-peptidase-3